MTYTVKFRDDALKEWLKLDKSIQQQFAKKLKKCSKNPHIPSAKLRGLKDCYKIKLRASGFRLVYQVSDDMLIIAVVTVGKRERGNVYNLASERMRWLSLRLTDITSKVFLIVMLLYSTIQNVFFIL